MFKISVSASVIPVGWSIQDYFLDRGEFLKTEYAREQDAVEQFNRQLRVDKAGLDGVVVSHSILNTEKAARRVEPRKAAKKVVKKKKKR